MYTVSIINQETSVNSARCNEAKNYSQIIGASIKAILSQPEHSKISPSISSPVISNNFDQGKVSLVSHLCDSLRKVSNIKLEQEEIEKKNTQIKTSNIEKEKLFKLKDLYDSGLIDEIEYQSKKSEILSSL